MALGPVLYTFTELEVLLRVGMPKFVLCAGIERATRGADVRRAQLARIIPEATYKHRRDRLTQDESGNAGRLARIVATTAHVWSDEDDIAADRLPAGMGAPSNQRVDLRDAWLAEFRRRSRPLLLP
ncbi:hypothetical protein K6W98_30060 [Burkholderia cepacia]|nr:hypothetical protein [Burkholderia cepacia]MBY4739003.1 hypothetical protein [Burkholderia cepacia]MBY4744076.1 hypothetical protein [Burkholderia cepacia]MBY4757061.1 hypothetical protein [Burkholderia cepacia]MBY4777083.1 hypothetical protein [Burkholderia cepacia]